jgi:hypothetical protein
VHGAVREEEIEMGRGRRRGLTMVAPTGGCDPGRGAAAGETPRGGGEVRDWFVSCWADLIRRIEEGSRSSERARPSLAQPGPA